MTGTIVRRALLGGAVIVGLAGAITHAQSGPTIDPFASSNNVYPDQTEYSGPMQVANLDYPSNPTLGTARRYGAEAPIGKDTAPRYVEGLFRSLGPSLSGLVNDRAHWNAKKAGWFDMIWLGEGTQSPDGTTDPTSGREPVGNTYTGQILPPRAFCNRPLGKGGWGMALAVAPPIPAGCDKDPTVKQGPIPTVPVQNHAVMYYNAIAAQMLARVWANPYAPNIDLIDFPEGSVVVKIEAVTSTEAEWPVVKGAGTWQVFRPTVADQINPPAGGVLTPRILTVRPFQMSVAIKDRAASPVTGWVFAAFVYDAASTGSTPWARFVPVGAMWGNDPEQTGTPNGNSGTPGDLRQTWFNDAAPLFTHGTRGWGGRLSGPMDVADRVNVLFTSGNNATANLRQVGASSCMSCHSVAEFPWTRNLYPAPNRAFPHNGQPFVLYQPGTPEWARWFQNPSVPRGVSNAVNPRGLDYDFALMFALGTQAAATGRAGLGFRRFPVH